MSRLVIARFTEDQPALAAWKELRRDHDAELHSAAPIQGIIEAHEVEPRRIAQTAGIVALLGTASAVLTQWWAGHAYPMMIGGRSSDWPGHIPAVIAIVMLWSALGGFGAFLWMARLPRLHDRFFSARNQSAIAEGAVLLAVRTGDEEAEAVAQRLRRMAAPQAVECIEDDG